MEDATKLDEMEQQLANMPPIRLDQQQTSNKKENSEESSNAKV